MMTRTFVGHDRELEDLAAGLSGGGRVAVHAIHGMGGVGKTQLAAHYARTHRGEYEQAAIDAARDWLERHHRWLVVFDNAPAPEAIAELLIDGPGGHVVITSRAHAD